MLVAVEGSLRSGLAGQVDEGGAQVGGPSGDREDRGCGGRVGVSTADPDARQRGAVLLQVLQEAGTLTGQAQRVDGAPVVVEDSRVSEVGRRKDEHPREGVAACVAFGGVVVADAEPGRTRGDHDTKAHGAAACVDDARDADPHGAHGARGNARGGGGGCCWAGAARGREWAGRARGGAAGGVLGGDQGRSDGEEGGLSEAPFGRRRSGALGGGAPVAGCGRPPRAGAGSPAARRAVSARFKSP